MTDISTFTDDELSGIGIGPEHGIAKTRLNEIITKVNSIDEVTEISYTPTTGTDWVDPDPDNVSDALDDLAGRVKTNDDHVAGDGSDHADVATNTTHSTGDGSDHADVATNTTHSTGDGSDHADVATNTAALSAVTAPQIGCKCTGLAAQTDEDEVSATVSGVTGSAFAPEEILIIVTAVGGSIAADGTINVATSSDGSDILSAQALTGLDGVGDVRRVPLAEAQTAIAADATLYANVEANDSTATTLTLDVYILGRQLTYA